MSDQQTEWMGTVFPERRLERVTQTRRAVFEQTNIPADDPRWGQPTIGVSERMTPWLATACANVCGLTRTALIAAAGAGGLIVLVLVVAHLVGWLS